MSRHGQQKRLRDRFLRGPLDRDDISQDARDEYVKLTYDMLPQEEDEESPILCRGESHIVLTNPGTGFLFDYQRELVDGLISIAGKPYPKNIALVALPTGGGKTRMAVWSILELMKARAIQQVLWLAPARELLDQAVDAFCDIWKVLPALEAIELVRCYAKGDIAKRDTPTVFFMTPQMLHNRIQTSSVFSSINLVMFDEAHYAIAPTYSQAVSRVREVSCSRATLIGLSATPGRNDEEGTHELVSLFGEQLVVSPSLGKNPVESLQERGVLARLQFERIILDKSWPGLTVERGDQKKQSNRQFETEPVRFDATIRVLSDLSVSGRTLAFAGSIQHANALAAVLISKGISASVVSSQTPMEQRREILRKFAGGDINVLVNKQLLATGYDCPSVEHVVLTVPIGSAVLFEQIIGRVTRGPRVGGTTKGTVWQVDNNLAIHGYPSSYYRFRDFDWTPG